MSEIHWTPSLETELVSSYCARSSVLEAGDLVVQHRAGPDLPGSRASAVVNLRHVPTGIVVRAGSEQPGGRTRLEARQARVDLLEQALAELDGRVEVELRERNRRQAVRCHAPRRLERGRAA